MGVGQRIYLAAILPISFRKRYGDVNKFCRTIHLKWAESVGRSQPPTNIWILFRLSSIYAWNWSFDSGTVYSLKVLLYNINWWNNLLWRFFYAINTSTRHPLYGRYFFDIFLDYTKLTALYQLFPLQSGQIINIIIVSKFQTVFESCQKLVYSLKAKLFIHSVV